MNAMKKIAKLAADPTLRLNLEKRGAGYRVRYCRRDGSGRRSALVVPLDSVQEVKRLVRESRKLHAQFVAEEHRRMAEYRNNQPLLRKLLDQLLRGMLSACPHGRIVRQRITEAFKCASALGLEAVEDFVAMRPWECRKGQAGRPQEL